MGAQVEDIFSRRKSSICLSDLFSENSINLDKNKKNQVTDKTFKIDINNDVIKEIEDNDNAIKNTKDTESEDAKDEVPDGGWGWFVVLGALIVNVQIGGYGRAFGFIFISLQDKFGSSAAVTAWIHGANTTIKLLLSPIANALCRRYGTRPIVIIGGILMTIGAMTTSVANSIPMVFVTHSLILGIGSSMALSPSIVMVGQYFKKKRSSAIGIASAGAGIGSIIYSQAYVRLETILDFSNTILILGSASILVCFSGFLYRPLKPKSHNIDVMEQEVEVGPPEKNTTKVIDEVNDSPKKTSDEQKPKNNDFILVRIFNFLGVGIFKDVAFLLFSISQALSLMTYVQVAMMVPLLGKEIGLTVNQCSLIISILGVGNVIGRIGSGFIFDIQILKNYRYILHSLSHICLGMFMLVWPWVTSFYILLGISGGYSIILGVSVAQRTNILCDIVGIGNLSAAHGMMLMLQGIGAFIGPLIGGYLRDSLGSYTYPFYFMAAMFTLAAFFDFAANIIAKKKTMTKVDDCSK